MYIYVCVYIFVYIYICIYVYIYIGMIPAIHISMLIDSCWCKSLQDYLVLVPEIHFLGVVPLCTPFNTPTAAWKQQKLRHLLSPKCWECGTNDIGKPMVRQWHAHSSCVLHFQYRLVLAWWLIPLSKWVITPVINGISRVNPLIIGVRPTYWATKWVVVGALPQGNVYGTRRLFGMPQLPVAATFMKLVMSTPDS